jgi:hypothetical protein
MHHHIKTKIIGVGVLENYELEDWDYASFFLHVLA